MGRGRRATRQRPAAPQRRCVGCRKVRPQADMLRIAGQGGQAAVGRENPGRGCYLCKDQRCAEAAVKTGQIGRALKGRAKNPQLAEVLGWFKDAGLPLA